MKTITFGIALLTAVSVSFAGPVSLDTSYFPKITEGLEPLSDGTFNPTKFWISKFRTNVANAEYYCNLAGHRLLSIRTERKEREIENIMEVEKTKGIFPWMSGQDIGQNGKWEWENGDKILFNRFQSSDTDTPLKNCMFLYKLRNEYLWHKEECSVHNYFICERKDLS